MTWRRSDLRPYQRFFVEKIKACFHPDPARRLPGLILALEPGAGKTGTTLTAIKDLHDSLTIRKTLIVAPLLVAQTVWPAEIGEWEHLRNLSWTLIRVEEDDAEVAVAGDAAYAQALAAHQADFDAQRSANMLLGASAGDARKQARAARSATPAKLAEADRQTAAAAAKEAKLARLAASAADVHIINKDALRWLWDHFGRGARWPYDLIVVDDVREGRSGQKRSKGKKDEDAKAKKPLSRFGILAAARKRSQATVQLTGTPTPKSLADMWGLAYLIDLGERLGMFKTPFLKKFFHLDSQYYTPKEPREGAFDRIMGSVKDIMFSLDPADLPQLPPYIVDPIRVKLSPDVLAAYKRFERQLVSEEYDVEAVNAGVLHGKKLQFANGSMFREDGEDVWIHDAKIEALKELVQRMNGVPLLVLYTYTFDVERIMTALPKAVLLRPENAVETVRLWNEDKIEVLLAHRASAGHGLNMQKGTGHMCEYGLTSDAELYLQALKRLLRSGRRGAVFNHVIMAEGTIDEEVFPSYLEPKIETQTRVMEAVRVSFQESIAPTELSS